MQLKVAINPIYSYLHETRLTSPVRDVNHFLRSFLLGGFEGMLTSLLTRAAKERQKRSEKKWSKFHYKASETLQHIAFTALKPGAAVLHGETWPLLERLWELDKIISEWNLQYERWKPKMLPEIPKTVWNVQNWTCWISLIAKYYKEISAS